MDPLSFTASVIAVIQIAGNIVKICGGYIQDAKNARDEILKLQLEVIHLAEVLQKLDLLLQSRNGSNLSACQTLDGPISKCCAILTDLQSIIDPGKRKKAMSRLGFRALTWPLKRAEVDAITSEIERFKSIIILSLQIDQT